MRESHFKSLLRSKELEIQYHQAKLEQQRRAQEMESSKSHQLTRQVSTFSQTETELRSQLNIYVEKFKQVSSQLLPIEPVALVHCSHSLTQFQVEDTLNSSNDLFLTFRKEMEEMSKKTKRLEKENLTLTRKQEATNQNIIKMADERTQTAKEVELLRKKNENLEKLCRGMQAQGRGQALMPQQGDEDDEEDEDDDGTESEYDDEYDADASIEEYDEESEEEVMEPPKRPFGPVPPPKNQMPNGIVGGPSLQVIGPAAGIRA
jgi:Myosin-like coiled-coil protein